MPTVWWEGWPTGDRPLFLELRDIDEVNGVARFDYVLDSPSLEMWRAAEFGYMHDQDVLDELNDLIKGNIITGGVLEIPLSEKVQTTKLEVWNEDLSDGVGYLIETQGIHSDRFRYKIGVETTPGVSLGYLVEESPEVFRLTADVNEATHVWGLATLGGNQVDAVPVGTDTNGLKTLVAGNTMRIYEG